MTITALESVLLAQPSIDGCAIVERTGLGGQSELVAYVVLAGGFTPAVWNAALAESAPGQLPSAYVSVSNLSVTEEGLVDEEALRRLPVLDEHLCDRWQDRLRQQPDVADAAVLIEERVPHVARVHLQDLLPNLTHAHDEKPHLDEPLKRPGHAWDGSAIEKPAFADGGRLDIPDKAPRTLGEALIRVAMTYPDHGLTYVEADGTQTLQSYPQLLAEASRILSGLRAHGLQPGDRVILQVQPLRDYYTTFWACILGGIVPATVAIARSYADRNDVTSKLYNAWLVLESPVVLASASLAERIRGLGRFFAMPDPVVLSIEDLEQYAPTEHFHAARAEDVFFLQLSSGSTGVPKCVQETHAGVVAHIHGSAQLNSYVPGDVLLNWLPVDHVGALLMWHLRATYLGSCQVQAQTDWILEEPLRWLDLLERYHATNTWAPNFAFRLVADRLADIGERHWDLSSVRYFLNGGEQVTLPVVRDFLTRTARFGVPPQAMQPAFGMAETCTAFTYSNDFDLQKGVRRLREASLGGMIEDADVLDEQAVSLVALGKIVPGMRMRIVDERNRLLPERVIGRLQVSGPSVTPGYLNNPEANAEAFVGDGWFNTGDLGFISDATLTITGRAKEMIIIRGANFLCHEIEHVVSSVETVEPTYAAACGVYDPGTGTEGLAIFFVPRTEVDEDELVEVVKAITTRVATELRISPSYVIPVSAAEFPRTTSGKIQRTRLKQALEAGAFAERIKAQDIQLERSNTLPDWFFRVVWRPAQPRTLEPLAQSTCLIFCTGEPLALELQRRLGEVGVDGILVEPGAEFERCGADQYRLDPKNPDQYASLFSTLDQAGRRPRWVVHTWSRGSIPVDVCDPSLLEQAQDRGSLSLLALVQAMAATASPDPQPTRLLAISSGVQPVVPDEPIHLEHAPLLGVLRTAPQEMPWLDCRHLDLEADDADAVLVELQVMDADREIAYRGGRRWVSRLERVDLRRGAQHGTCTPVLNNGVYLLSGGAGGIGLELARFLRRRYAARLVLVGRRPSHEVRAALSTLDGLPGEAVYAQADVADLERMREVVAETRQRWGSQLAGLIHLAGAYHERLLIDETREGFLEILRPKVLGVQTLDALAGEQPGCAFINFSSANGLFGGYAVGAYSAANAYLDAFTHARRRRGLRATCLSWSLWDEVGLASRVAFKGLSRAGGYASISIDEGMHSFLVALHADQAHLVIGLDPRRPRVARRLASEPEPRRQVHAYVVGHPARSVTKSTRVTDRFGQASVCVLTCLEALPRTSAGDVDRLTLAGLGSSIDDQAALTPVEGLIARVWQEVLGVSRVGRDRSFFELGGNSLLVVQVLSRLRQRFQVNVGLAAFFEAPTVRQLARLLEDSAAPHQTEHMNAIPVAERGPRPPLSHAQQPLWFLNRLNPGSTSYNESFPFRLRGRLDTVALQRALNEIVRRHEMLRTVFPAFEGQPYQDVRPFRPLPVAVIDLGYLPDDEREYEMRRLLEAESDKPFDLASGPLFRVQLLRLSEEDNVLQISIHHIVFDGWSIDVLHRELASAYDALSKGEIPERDPLTIQYVDYAIWQRSGAAQARLESQLAYWRGRLEGAPMLLELPTDHARPAIQSTRGSVHRFTVAGPLVAALTRLAQTENATLFMVLLAAFQTLLQRYTGRDDMLVGSPIAGRVRPELEELIGFFVNTLVFRGDLAGNPSFRALLARTRESALEAYAHQDLPLTRLVEELQPHRARAHSPLVQVVMALHNAPMRPLQLPGLVLEPMTYDVRTVKFDMSLEFFETPNGLSAELEYCTDLFERETLERLSGHLMTLLEGVVANPDQLLSDLPLLSSAERQQVLVEWNQTSRSYPRDETIPSLFDEQVARTPSAVALLCDDHTLTYQELNRRANQVAHHLRSLGVTSETRVGICAERSVELVVGLLGILKAGGAYVPVDPGYPADRLAFMLEDTAVAVVLGRRDQLARMPLAASRRVVLDEANPELLRQPLTNPESTISGSSLAYVLYTSGSTGVPKGVAVEHRSVLRLVKNTNFAQFGPDEVFLQLAALSFDASTLELWAPLLNGGRLAIAPPGLLSLNELSATLSLYGVTTLWLTAGLFHAVVDNQITALRGVHQLLAGGDVLSVAHVQRVLKELPHCRLINGYGPTENTTFTCCYLANDPAQIEHTVPIGRPIANTQVFILDRHRQPVPIGAPGELYIGGDGLAREYLNRPELTTEKFVPHPFSTDSAARLYRTGDLVRYRSDGNIEFLGRLDQQIKIHGFRIEPGEIEASLARHPAIRASAVVAREDPAGDKRLVAYVVADPSSLPVLETLRAFLKERLPDHMVPSAFVRLERLPLTSNGKLDRTALPAPEQRRSDSDAGAATTLSDTEQLIASTWREALQLEHVGIHDNFFDLGGGSLLAMRVQSKLQDALGIDVAVTELFQYPSVSALAKHLAAAAEGSPAAGAQAQAARQLHALGRFRSRGNSSTVGRGE